MSRKPRWIGYGLMAVTLVVALGGKQGWFTGVGPVPAAALAIILGALGVMLVMTDLMVRGMIGQSSAMAQAEDRANTQVDDRLDPRFGDEAPRGE